VLIRVVTKKNIAGTLSELVDTRAAEDDNVEILGPHFSRNRQGKNEYKLLLKSGVREKLHAAAEFFLEAFKNSRDVKVRVDVDPIEI
jgi:primosomal protein N'